MPPPSLERKEQPLSRQQKDKLKGSFKPEDRPRRRSSFQLPPVPFTPEPKQNSYTEQFRRRRSQQEMADQSPRANGSRRMERRRSSEDAGERPNSLQQPDEKRQENGYHHSLADAVDKKPAVVAAVSGKGSDCSPAPIDRDQRKATMTKKRRAPCCRSSVILAVVAGVATVTVAGGLIVCRLYPSSLAAASIRIVVGKVEQKFVLLLKNEVMPFARTVEEVMREKGMTLLRNRRLRSLARAADALVEEKLRGSLTLTGWTTGATMSFELVKDIPEQLKPAVSAAVGLLKLSLEGMHVHLQTFFMFIEQQMGEDTELLDPVRSFLLAVIYSLTKVLTQCGEWTTPWFEWIGLKSGVIDESLSCDQFLSPLEGNRAAIQSIGRSITEQESQVLQDVKRLEKRRVTIASDTNEILSKTRDFALESVHSVKMAALDAIELRLKKLEEQYARSFEQALKENEQMSREVEREGGAESQSRATAATTLNQYLILEDKTVGEKVVELAVTEEQKASDAESRDKRATYHAEEDQESVTFPAVPTEQSSSEDLDLGNDENVQTVATEDQVIVDLVETVVVEPIPLDASLENEDLAEEHGSGSMDDVLGADHICEDEALVIEENEATVTEVETGEEEQSLVMEVLVDLHNSVAENTHNKVTTFDSQNLSEQDALTQEGTYMEKDRLRVVVPGEGTDMKLDVEVEKIAYENTEQVAVDRVISDVRTRVAIQPDLENKVEEQQSDELTPPAENVFVYEEILVASDLEVRSEKVDADVMLEVVKDVKIDTVITALERVGETDSKSHPETTVNQEIPERDTSLLEERITGDIRLEEAVDDAVREQQALEVKVIQEELEQLEQVLLKEVGERVEEELRAIAEDEVLWSRIEELPADEAVKENAGLTDNWLSSLGVSTPALPRSILTQIGLLSVAFIGLAVLTAYLLVRYRKHGLLFRPSRRRRRWRKLADIDAEEVVLLPEVSSDEEGDEEQNVSKVDVLELVSSISVKTTAVLTSDEEEAGEEEKTLETIEAQGKPDQEEENVTPVSESVASRTTVVELVQTTVENTATPASVDSIDTTHASVSPPPASRLQTPDTSQRTRRRRQIRT